MAENQRILNSILTLAFCMFYQQPVAAETAGQKSDTSYRDRLQFVQTLLDKSSATKQIDNSGNLKAAAEREKARAHFDKARQAYDAGDVEVANQELVEATRVMFEAVRLAKKEEHTDIKKRRDYQERLDSINALMEAHDRVADEKGKQSDGVELKNIVADKVRTANTMLKEGNLDKAREVLDEAYVAAKIAINTIRGGETLVRTLHFETSEEEYLYEIDRNDTHKMLLRILNKKKDQGKTMSKMTQSFVEKAAVLRKDAEQQAASGDHENAIHTLEESTRNLVRALRGSGILFPVRESFLPMKPEGSGNWPGVAIAAVFCLAIEIISGPMLLAEGWRILSEDGLHDPETPGLELLQEPKEALSVLPKDTAGNKVDWVEALRDNYISPRSFLREEKKLEILDSNILLKGTGDSPFVLFPHQAHTEWLECSNCHNGMFATKAGETPITMLSILQGEYCGRCHGAVSFPLTECNRCHSVPQDSVSSTNR